MHYHIFYPIVFNHSELNRFIKQINNIVKYSNSNTVLQDFNSIGLAYSKLVNQKYDEDNR